MPASRAAGVVAAALAALLGLTAAIPAATRTPPVPVASATVTIYGRAGSFGATAEFVPSGQTVTTRPVDGWGFPPGQQPHHTALGADGTVFLAGLDHNAVFGEPKATSDEVVVGVFTPGWGAPPPSRSPGILDPRAGRYDNVRIRTMAGRDRATGPGGDPAAPSIADLEPVNGGQAMAFTVRPTRAGQDPATAGAWPAFGVLTRTNGRWSVARGPGWLNQWTDLDRTGADAAGTDGAAAGGPPAGLGEMTALPASRDIIAARHLDNPGPGSVALVALRLAGPDGAGRFTVTETGRYTYPAVRNPTGPGNLTLTPIVLHADPTGRSGDERFVVSWRVAADNDGAFLPGVLQEFRYDAASGAIRPVSPPFLPGDRQRDTKAFFGYGAAAYDSQGNLWAGRLDGFRGGRLAVYASVAGARGPGGPGCPYNPAQPMHTYVTTADGRTVWGRSCRPDYDILQAQHLLGAQGFAEDPETHDLVMLTLGGGLLPIRRAGAGRTMSFRVGNPVDLGRKLLPTAEGNFADHRIGPIDAGHRLWVTGMHARPNAVRAPLDQWLYSVDVGDLFDPQPVRISEVPGRVTTVQAEHTLTTTTWQRRDASGNLNVDSAAYWIGCADWPPNVGCGYDGAAGDGFVLADDSGLGYISGAVDYRIRVPVAGNYRFAYRAATFEVVRNARLELTAGGRTYPVPINTGGNWRTVVQPELVALPAGAQTIRLAVARGGAGWSLNWFTLQRA
jgi:hypothetical protein